MDEYCASGSKETAPSDPAEEPICMDRPNQNACALDSVNCSTILDERNCLNSQACCQLKHPEKIKDSTLTDSNAGTCESRGGDCAYGDEYQCSANTELDCYRMDSSNCCIWRST